jgi:hypothetical protein
VLAQAAIAAGETTARSEKWRGAPVPCSDGSSIDLALRVALAVTRLRGIAII